MALQFTPPSSVQATINLTSILDAASFTGVPGRSTLFEKVAFLAPGRATGTGTFRLELEGESFSVPFTTSYQLLGAQTVRPEGALLVDTDLTYHCGLSQVTSRLCLSGVAALVPVPRAALFGMGIGLLALRGFLIARKRARSSAG